MTTRSKCLALLLVVAAVAAIGAPAPAHAWGSESRLTYLTFSAPVALPGARLDAGTYAFELAAPLTSSNAVLVRNQKRNAVYFLGFTQRVPRPPKIRQSGVTLGEAPRGEPQPIAVWYPPEFDGGLQFIYSR
jgi:hypothetical protein